MRVLESAVTDQSRLVARAAVIAPSLELLLRTQWETLGGTELPEVAPAPDVATLYVELATAATVREDQAVEAVSPDLAMTLGSIAAALRVWSTGAVT